MNHRRGKLNVPHSLATDDGTRNLHAAFVANHALKPNAAVFSAIAFPILGRAENPLGEKAVFFRPLGSVIDCFGFYNFAERIFYDFGRGSQC